MPKTTATDVPRYFRWVGSKERLVARLLRLFPAKIPDLFVSPFLGGGALELALLAGPAKDCARITLSDLNPHLIAAWRMGTTADPTAVRDLFERLRWYESEDKRDPVMAFSNARCDTPREDWERAARFLYLNQVAWHGLWRENGAGIMNTPREDTRKTFRAEVVIERVKALRTFLAPFQGRIAFLCQDFALTLTAPDISRSVAYMDPPYLPQPKSEGNSRDFTKYGAKGFGLLAHRHLASLARGPRLCVVSNSDTPTTAVLYAHAKTVHKIKITHAVGPQAESRIEVGEVAMIFERTGP